MASSNSALTGTQTTKIERTGILFIGGIGFDRLMIVFCCWFVGGLYLDGWAHDHGLVDKTFFTPWHAVLYSGYFACALVLTVTIIINHLRGQRWLSAIPQGYGLSLLGAPLFLLAGVGDLIWHTLFGFEVGIEPLLSPTHLLLAFSGILIMSGPLRATWRRTDPIATHNWATLLPALLSLLAVFSVITFFTDFAHPFDLTWTVTAAPANSQKALGAAAVLLQTAILMGFLLLAMRRWWLPTGTFTLILTLNVILMSVLGDQYRLIPGVLLTGILADLFYWRLQPSVKHVDVLRVFAFSLPFVYYLCYFITLMITSGIAWSIHLWLGSTVMAGVLGLLLSYLLMPPSSPVQYEG